MTSTPTPAKSPTRCSRGSPTQNIPVTLPPGVQLRAGTVNPHPQKGGGNVVQYEIVSKGKKGWYGATQELKKGVPLKEFTK